VRRYTVLAYKETGKEDFVWNWKYTHLKLWHTDYIMKCYKLWCSGQSKVSVWYWTCINNCLWGEDNVHSYKTCSKHFCLKLIWTLIDQFQSTLAAISGVWYVAPWVGSIMEEMFRVQQDPQDNDFGFPYKLKIEMSNFIMIKYWSALQLDSDILLKKF
jgi:hypothetical protein